MTHDFLNFWKLTGELSSKICWQVVGGAKNKSHSGKCPPIYNKRNMYEEEI